MCIIDNFFYILELITLYKYRTVSKVLTLKNAIQECKNFNLHVPVNGSPSTYRMECLIRQTTIKNHIKFKSHINV